MGTWILIVVIFAVTDEKNGSAGNLAPLIIGLCACIIGLSYGSVSGWVKTPKTSFYSWFQWCYQPCTWSRSPGICQLGSIIWYWLSRHVLVDSNDWTVDWWSIWSLHLSYIHFCSSRDTIFTSENNKWRRVVDNQSLHNFKSIKFDINCMICHEIVYIISRSIGEYFRLTQAYTKDIIKWDNEVKIEV